MSFLQEDLCDVKGFVQGYEKGHEQLIAHGTLYHRPEMIQEGALMFREYCLNNTK